MMTSMHINFQKQRYERQAKNNLTYPDNIFGLIIVVFDRIYSERNRYKAKKQRKKYFYVNLHYILTTRFYT